MAEEVTLVPVDHDPFAQPALAAPSPVDPSAEPKQIVLTPVDHDPFAKK